MAKYVIIGHGGYSPASHSYAPEVLVPPNTKLAFFADAGQALTLPYKDYTNVAAELWDQLKEVGEPIGPKGVTYNYRLTPDTTDEHRQSALAADWGGATPYFVSAGDTYLCTGTAATCPTPKLNVVFSRHDELVAKGDAAVKAFKKWVDDGASGDLPEEVADFGPRLTDVPEAFYDYVADGVPDQRWEHDCSGILGELGGGGSELVWLACASISIRVPERAEMPVLDTSSVTGPGLQNKDWVPDDDAYKQARKMNADNVKGTDDKATVSIVVGGAMVLIGPGHDNDHADYVRRQSDIEEGQITVTKGGAFSKGGMTVTGISAKQALVKSEIGEFSDKKITFA
jgi:hypothetical protein